MEHLTLKSAVVVAAMTALPAVTEAQAPATKIVTPIEQVQTKEVSKAAKAQIQRKTNVGKGEPYVKDGWFKVNKPADKVRPVEKINVKDAASKVKG